MRAEYLTGPYAKAWLILICFAIAAAAYLAYRIFGRRKPSRIPSCLQRGDNYRKSYFKQNKGLFGKGLYFCPYCGKLLWKRENIEIDHINSIHRVQQSAILRKLFEKLPGGVNNIVNLVHSCSRCNRRKGAKGGMWVFLGYYGQYFMPVLRVGIFGTAIYLFTRAALFGGWAM